MDTDEGVLEQSYVHIAPIDIASTSFDVLPCEESFRHEANGCLREQSRYALRIRGNKWTIQFQSTRHPCRCIRLNVFGKAMHYMLCVQSQECSSRCTRHKPFASQVIGGIPGFLPIWMDPSYFGLPPQPSAFPLSDRTSSFSPISPILHLPYP